MHDSRVGWRVLLHVRVVDFSFYYAILDFLLIQGWLRWASGLQLPVSIYFATFADELGALGKKQLYPKLEFRACSIAVALYELEQ